MRDDGWGSVADRVTVAVFALLLLVPAALTVAGFAHADAPFIRTNENRLPFVAPPPSAGALATGGWERDAERAIADAFPLRSALIAAYDGATYRVFGDVGSPLVTRGRDGWLFLASDERAYYDGTYRPTPAAVRRLVAVFARRSAWAAAHRARYVFVLAPNKSTIYPQFLPSGIVPVAPSVADQLVPALRAAGVRSVDVRAALIAASRAGEVYSHGDTHWNGAGAYLAYRAIVAAVRDAGVHDRIDAHAIVRTVEPGAGDLLGLAGIAGSVGNSWVAYRFAPRAHPVTDAAFASDPALSNFRVSVTAVDDAGLPSAVAIGDSFVEQLEPFLAEDFRRAVFMHHQDVTAEQFDAATIARERPAVVIEELVERNFVSAERFAPDALPALPAK